MIHIGAIEITWSRKLPARIEIGSPWPERTIDGPSILVRALVETEHPLSPQADRVLMRVADRELGAWPLRHRTLNSGRSALDINAAVSMLDLPPTFVLDVSVTQSDGEAWPLCRITGTRRACLAPEGNRLQPLLLVSLGRSGSTWLMRLLGEHPQVIRRDRYPYEARIGQYFADFADALLRQASQLDRHADFYWGDADSFAHLGAPAIANLCIQTLADSDRVYSQLAETAGKPEADHFIEKAGGDPAIIERMRNLYGTCKVLLLVRDFRDIIASVLAFNRKRGTREFGHNRVTNDLEYVELMAGFAQSLLAVRTAVPEAVTVRYEALMQHPEATLASTLEALHLDSDREMISRILTAAEHDTPQMIYHRTVDDPRSQSIGRWRTHLDSALQAHCQTHLHDVLQAFGYDD
ncbi:Sulfotransferase family protein [Allochromatium warmingii]|uniref:Sulfotransferase family protein n=1 Tax=Allochromatium warmingii TaxID=61595 RepID=A0A1H3E557_ALLWA|nr:sulfotransferase [Allochromatium warmingii]SDX73747.1 Sulfotransferase family protein [Allochromatium warmingii]